MHRDSESFGILPTHSPVTPVGEFGDLLGILLLVFLQLPEQQLRTEQSMSSPWPCP